MVVGYEYLANGSVITGVSAMYTAMTGSWWIILLFLFSVIMSYVVARSPGATFLVSAGGTAFIVLKLNIPVWTHFIFYTITVISLALWLFQVFGKSE